MKIVRRIADPLEGNPNVYLEISAHDNGDYFVEIRGQTVSGELATARIQFLSSQGGGWHPNTINALDKLINAIEKDNKDPDCKERYKEK